MTSCRQIEGERRSGSHKRLLYCVNVNRTSLDHLPLGVVADIDEMSHGWSIAPRKERGSVYFLGVSATMKTILRAGRRRVGTGYMRHGHSGPRLRRTRISLAGCRSIADRSNTDELPGRQ